MMVKEIIKREFHFDDSKECDKHIQIMKNEGYKLLSSASEDDWYFICEKQVMCVQGNIKRENNWIINRFARHS